MSITELPERQVLSAAQVAALLGCRHTFTAARRAALEAAGFPAKLPGLNGWSKPAILRWLEANGAVEAAAAPPERRSPLARRFAS